MTIKRRLFISNILMLIIPVLLSFVLTSGVVFVFTETTGYHDKHSFGGNEEQFNDSIKRANILADRWSQNVDLRQMEDEINSFNEKYSNMKISLSIYEGKNLVYPSLPFVSSSILDTALTQDSNSLFIMDNTAVYRRNVGGYCVILSSTDFRQHNSDNFKKYKDYVFGLGIIIFIFIITIIVLTNRYLTRFVFRSIMTPLDTLVYGVHQIRDGNLNYNIDYTEKDEFAEVCSDFNEMAHRLLESVNARQKDEANRKELIAGISHDLRTPLTSIKAYVEGLEKGVATTPETQKRYLDTIKSKASDLEHIVNQLFLFSKLDIGEFPFYMEKVDIGKELFNMTVTLSEEYEKKGLSIILEENIENTYVQADIVQIRNAIINVLENSVKYKNKEQGQMKISSRVEKDYVTITLADNGPGVPKEAIEKLFDVFYRSDPSRSNPSKGSGLGLSITAKILERLGGSIRAENVPEGGLSIIMMLPIDAECRTIDNCSGPKKNTRGKTIDNYFRPIRSTGRQNN